MIRLAPEWLERVTAPVANRTLRKWWMKTTKEVLDELTANEKLKTVLAGQWGYYGSPPSRSSFAMHAVTTRHFWNGGYYPEGGASVIAENFLEPVKQSGGQIRTRAAVQEILVENGRARGVRLADGVEILADLVVSGANAKTTVRHLLPQEIKRQSWARSIDELGQSPPHICLHIGTEGDLTGTEATVANQWYMETWDMEWTEWDLEDPSSIAPVLYISYPSLKDPAHEAGPNNRQTAEVVTFVPWKSFEKWRDTRRGKREKDYMEFKKGVEERLIAQLKKHIPGVMAKAVFTELSTPLSTTFFTRSEEGAIYGLEPTPDRFSCRALRPRTPVKGLYLSGSDVGTLGVVGAMIGGIFTAAAIEPRVLKKLQ
jgi:all-trans-retinol 13,14-reductase